MNDLWRTAVHESGHATSAVLLHATAHAGPVTIQPGRSYLGIWYSGHARKPPPSDMDDLARPYPLVPARLRRFYEVKVMVWLAGEIAADLHAARSAPEPETGSDSVNVVPVQVELPRREAEILEVAAARDTSDSDLSRAMKTLAALHFDDHEIAHWHAGMLALETQALLAAPRASRMVRGLAAELVKRKTLSARQWKSFLASVQ